MLSLTESVFNSSVNLLFLGGFISSPDSEPDCDGIEAVIGLVIIKSTSLDGQLLPNERSIPEEIPSNVSTPLIALIFNSNSVSPASAGPPPVF